MNLHEAGSSVSGTFGGSTPTISGHVTGTTLTGTLSKFNGTDELTLCPDMNPFTGT